MHKSPNIVPERMPGSRGCLHSHIIDPAPLSTTVTQNHD